MSAAATSFTLVTATDRDGNALSGLYGFIIDEGTADEEFVLATISGTTGTVVYRGIDSNDPNTEVSGNKKLHRRGASVKITDYPILGVLRQILNGEATIPNKLSYNSHPTFSSNTELVDKKYVDDVAVSGASDADTSTKGLVEEATQTEVDARTTTGGTSAKLFAPLDKIRASKYHDYAADSVGTDSYAITITPAITAYSAGQVFVFKAGTANTGAATLNVSGLGAKTIKKNYNQDLETGDILANQVVIVVYDGTNMQLQSHLGKPKISQNGSEIYAADSVGTDSYAVTLTPAVTAYTDGLVVNFKAGTANTDAATLNVNGLGAVTIKKHHDQDLETGDIEQNQIVTVVYNSSTAKFQMISQTAVKPIKTVSHAMGTTTRAGDAASGSQVIAHGLSATPTKIRLTCMKHSTGGSFNAMSIGAYPTTSCVFWANAESAAGLDTTNIIVIKDNGDTAKQEATVSVDSTNITLTWTKTGSPANDNINIVWEADTEI